MANDMKKAEKDGYGEVMGRLQHVVDELEGGSLSLEDSLDKFAEGMRLVKRGEQLLSDAERRIEQLLNEQGDTAPLEEKLESTAPTSRAALKVASADEEDVPF